jgi:hypothetical protein
MTEERSTDIELTFDLDPMTDMFLRFLLDPRLVPEKDILEEGGERIELVAEPTSCAMTRGSGVVHGSW